MSTITIATRDEMYFVALPQVAYFKAEGHYTTVFFLNGTRLLLPCGLAKVREKILATDHPDGAFTQMGRSLLVNTEAVCCINPRQRGRDSPRNPRPNAHRPCVKVGLAPRDGRLPVTDRERRRDSVEVLNIQVLDLASAC